MFGGHKRSISDSEMNNIREVLAENEVPYSIGVSLSSGTKFIPISFVTEDDHVRFVAVPDSPTQEVQNEPVLVDYHAVLVDNKNNTAAVVESVDLDTIEFLPELRQSFYEGDSFADREADYRYHFDDEDTEVAVRSSDPVDRLDDPIEITAVEYIGGFAPRKWLLETSEGAGLYLRERSGSIRLYEDVEGESEIFNAYIGREHPGTPLRDETDADGGYYKVESDEILGIISAVNYINIIDKPSKSVSDDIKEAYNDHQAKVFEEISEHNQKVRDNMEDDIEFDDIFTSEDE